LYNLSLAQTLLFKATGMTISFKGNYKEIFRAIKYFGLMYSPVGNKIRVEGASSLLKLSERYGTSLAKLLPVIVNSDEWGIDAEIVIRRDTPRIYHFMMDSRDRDLLMSGELKREEAAFDSGIEERFYNEFTSSAASRSWELIREPDAVFTESKAVFIPDFKFKHKEMGIETYFEIVGFWTDEYITRKLSKLRAVPFNILVAIDKNLACFNSAQFDLGLNQPVILFSRKVPVGEVLKYLANIEREEIKREVERLTEMRIELEGDLILIKDIAMRYNVGKEAARACLNHPEYVVFKEVVVKKELLNEVKDKLVSKNIQLYVEARRIIEDMGLSNPDEVLAELGFKVKWIGLDMGAASIE
jgi:predicted nuclease of restriction endonuclease-like RecB superfamily